MKVGDVMTRDPVTIEPGAPLSAALGAMRERRIRHLPVVDADGRLCGILTDRDLRRACFARLTTMREADRDLTVEECMSWAVITTDPDVPLGHAATVMCERRIGALPVVRNGRLVGIVTEHDLLRALARAYPATGVDPDAVLW